jgi:hypothetical protein
MHVSEGGKMENDKCPTVFLEDQPSNVDILGGAHERLTDAIVQLIKMEKGGITIGIEGTWGSGKSTVIKLLSKKIENESIHICYFDAWAHEGDPLRRTFLEKLIDQLSEKKWVRPESWKEKELELQGKLSKTTTDAEPQITNFGKLLIPISLLSIPIGSALINKGADVGLSFGSSLEPNNYFIWGIVSLLLPFIIMASAIILKKFKWSSFIWISKKLELDKTTDIWSIFLQKYKQTTTSHSSQKPNPTSVEFENSFIELIDEALKDENHSILIILDNLDRIASSDALAILSTLQTFLQCNGGNKDNFERLWIIIPYDLNGFIKIWRTNGDDDEKIAISMIEKRIQIKFQIPPIVLSNSKEYFINLMQCAFPFHTDLEFYQCYRIYYQSTINNSEYPTPREIKSFINQIGSFHRQWNSEIEIPLSHITYYVLQLRTFHENKIIIEKIIDEKIPTKEYEYFLGEKVTEDLAVLIFNVEHRVATQLLLSKPLKESLINLDEKRIKKIFNNFESGFWSILESFDNSDWSALSPSNLAYATIGIDNVFRTYRSSPKSKDIVFRSLQNAYLETETWPIIDDDISQGITIILAEYSNKKLADHIFQTINTVKVPSYSSFSKEVIYENESIIRELCKNRIKIIECLHEHYYSYGNFPGKIEILFTDEPNNVLGIIEFCAALNDIVSSKVVKDLFITDIDKDSLLLVFNSLINNGFFTYRYIRSISIFENLLPTINWGSSKYQIQQRIISNPEIPNGALIEGLWVFDDYDVPNEKPAIELTQILSALLSNVNPAFDQKDYLSISWIMIYILLKGKSTELFSGTEYSQEGYDKLIFLFDSSSIQDEILPILIPIIKGYDLIEPWVEVTSTLNSTYKLSRGILTSISLEDDPSKEITGSFVIDFWEKISQIFESSDSWDPFILQLSKKVPFGDLIIESPFSPTKASLYSSLIRSNVQPSKKIKKWVIKNLLVFTSSFWVEDLIAEFNCVNLVITLVENDEKEFLDIDFQEGIEKFAEKVISGESQPKLSPETWFRILDALKQNNRLVLKKKLLDSIKSVESINPNFYAYFGQEILDYNTIYQDTDVIRRVFTGQFIEKEDETGLRWLKALVEKYPNIIYEYPYSEDASYFIEKLTRAAKTEMESGFKHLCIEICEMLGINLSQNENNIDQEN